MSHMLVVTLGVLVALLLVLTLVVSLRGRGGDDEARTATPQPHDETPAAARASEQDSASRRAEPEAPRLPRAAVVVNPTKFDDVDAVRATITEHCLALGWDEPLWLETTEDDPGSGQTKQAVHEGVDVVCPLGGDGTVRTVGSELTNLRTDIPMGLLPGGTGNLLARNLDLPVDSLADALTIALTGQDKRVDVGVLEVTPTPVDGEHEVDDQPVDAEQAPPETTGPDHMHFLVMAGMGFDADIMADAPETLKAKVGWPAYLVSGLKHLWGSQFKAKVRTDDELFSRHTRSVIVGNVGKIQGLTLMPEAVIDDGQLDVLVLSPQGGVGWGVVALRLITAKRKGHDRVTHHTTTRLTVQADREVQVQLDGDTIGPRRCIRAHVLPEALVVRVASDVHDGPVVGSTQVGGQ